MTNKLIIIGNLTKDPDYSVSQNGTPMCRFTVAVNRRGGEETDFFRVTTFRKNAENCAAYLSKGRKVCIVGEVHINEYTDRDGATRTSVDVLASEVEFLSPKDEEKPAKKKETFEQVSADTLPF